ncbi:MAG TPA: hypothetical protein V6C81_22860 [Planktothrix sp.]|jgi:hypothetical protein
MEIVKERRAGPKRIGELLVAANVIKPEVLLEALQIAKKSNTPLGRVLMSIGELTERDVQTAIEVQSLLREGVISSDFGIRALNVAIKGCVPLEEAFKRLGWKAPQREIMPGSELGELLLEAGVVDSRVLDEGIRQSMENNLPLGRCLVLNRALPSQLLASALTAQVLLRDGKITKEQALNGLRSASKKHQSIESSLQEAGAYRPPSQTIRFGELLAQAGIVTEGDKVSAIEVGLVNQQPIGQVLVQNGMISNQTLEDSLRLQDMVANGHLTGVQAAEILRAAHQKGTSVEQILSERSTKEDEIARANEVLGLLNMSGVVGKDEMTKAADIAGQLNCSMGEVLLTTGYVDKRILAAAVQGKSLVDDGILKAEQVAACLHYCQKTGVDFPDALREVSWTPPAEQADPRDPQGDSWLNKLFKGKKT